MKTYKLTIEFSSNQETKLWISTNYNSLVQPFLLGNEIKKGFNPRINVVKLELSDLTAPGA